MVNNIIQRSTFSRLWLIPFTAGPGNRPNQQGLARAGELAWNLGDVSPIFIPHPDRYGQFRVAGKIQGEREFPTMELVFRVETEAKMFLTEFARKGCDFDVQIHMGVCQDPNSFNEGWQKILVLPRALPTAVNTGALGALAPGEDEMVDETIPVTAEDVYEIVNIAFSEQAVTEVVQEVVDIVVCDAITCGMCGLAPTNGCDIVFALTLTAGGSPGLAAEIVYTEDAGVTWRDTLIDTLAANEDPNRLACVGSNLVVVSEDSESLHFADISDILDQAETWVEVTTGFVATNGPLAIWAASQCDVFIVGENGFIYFTEDPTASVIVQDAGVATTQNLNDVHAFDKENAVTVGNSNAVVLTRNGGTTWAPITGPNPGVNLNAVWMRGKDEWFIGDAGGQLWYTIDGGNTWTEKTFTGSGAGVIRDIKFINGTVGYMAHDTGTPAGRILRTVDGGYSWYVLPEGDTVLPANDRINAVAPCSEADPNTVYAGGLADDAVDGIIVKGA